MTLSGRLSSALATLRWGPSVFAAAVGVSDRSVHRWLRGTNEPPAALVEWAERLAEYHRQHPPPRA